VQGFGEYLFKNHASNISVRCTFSQLSDKILQRLPVLCTSKVSPASWRGDNLCRSIF